MDYKMTQEQIADALWEAHPDGTITGDKFLQLALEFNFDASQHFDVVGDSYDFQAWVNEAEAANYMKAAKGAATGPRPAHMPLLPPEEFALSHAFTPDGEALMLSGKARALAAAHVCEFESGDPEMELSFLIREMELLLPEETADERDHLVRYPVTRRACNLCEQPDCYLGVCHRMVVYSISYMFED